VQLLKVGFPHDIVAGATSISLRLNSCASDWPNTGHCYEADYTFLQSKDVSNDAFLFMWGDKSKACALSVRDSRALSLTYARNVPVQASIGTGTEAGELTNVLQRGYAGEQQSDFEDPWIGCEGNHHENYHGILYGEVGFTDYLKPCEPHRMVGEAKNSHQGSGIFYQAGAVQRLAQYSMPCSAGYFCPTGRNHSAMRCNETLSSIRGEALFCPFGNSFKEPRKCQQGYYCSHPAITKKCPAGSYCAIGSGAPTSCSTPGDYCPVGSSTPNPCPASFLCPSTAIKIQCPSGSYCVAGSSVPANCSTPGDYCGFGSSTPVPCPAGSYCPNASIKTQCPTGSYCVQGTVTPLMCSLGDFCPAASSSAELCPSGWYCEDASTKSICPAHYYCPVGSTAPTICSSPQIRSPEGSGSPYDCFIPQSNSESDMFNQVWMYVAVIAACLTCVVIVCYMAYLYFGHDVVVKEKECSRLDLPIEECEGALVLPVTTVVEGETCHQAAQT
jgi:hypothetical protein